MGENFPLPVPAETNMGGGGGGDLRQVLSSSEKRRSKRRRGGERAGCTVKTCVFEGVDRRGAPRKGKGIFPACPINAGTEQPMPSVLWVLWCSTD